MNYITAGESHGKNIVVIVDDVPCGISLSESDINYELQRRSSGFGRSSRQDHENNSCRILSGVNNKKTTGNPIAIEIDNYIENQKCDDSQCEHQPNNDQYYYPRPGHADINGVMKYNFDNCINVFERASARETAVRVAAGAIAKEFLAKFNVEIYGYTISIGSVSLKENHKFLLEDLPTQTQIAMSDLMCPDLNLTTQMIEQIERANLVGDSLGGSFRLVATGLVPGLGSYTQGRKRLDSLVMAAVSSVPSVKAVQIGCADYMSKNVGSACIDQIVYDDHGDMTRTSNYSGGIEGGLTNGMPLICSAIVKPVPSIKKSIKTIDLRTMQNIDNICNVRADTCIVPNACVVAEAELAFVLANEYQNKFGHDSVNDIKYAYASYKQRLKSFK